MSGSITLSALGLTPGVAGLALLIGLGLIVWALSGGDFRRLVGAVLMGVGVACAMGCTVGQGLSGVSTGISTVSSIDLRQKVDALQQRMADDLRKNNDDNAQLRRSMLDLSNQIEALRNEVATIRGQNERLAHDVADMQRNLKDIAQGVNERSRKFEPGKVTVDGKEFVAEPAETQEFDAALATLHKGDFAAAQTGFVTFMKRYPQSGYKPSALFWLGHTQYALRNYRDAEANFQALVTAEPGHLRAPEALLSMANCQVELKDVKSARKTLDDLMKTYPQSEAASVAKERLAKLK
ncbi:tol-pal system protein YbgF [Polaromonas sp. P1(28)-13]|nr:tol-pal system protein YbgF [Polaromonas sp. P1(28)-13]